MFLATQRIGRLDVCHRFSHAEEWEQLRGLKIAALRRANGTAYVILGTNKIRALAKLTAARKWRCEQEFEGTGIGLANVQSIISRHGGRAWAEGAVEPRCDLLLFVTKSNFRVTFLNQENRHAIVLAWFTDRGWASGLALSKDTPMKDIADTLTAKLNSLDPLRLTIRVRPKLRARF